MTASTLVKSSTGNYQTRSNSPLKVGDRVAIQPQNLSPRRQYLANATGEIKSITGTKAAVMLDEPTNKAYKPHTVKVDLCSLKLICAVESVQVSHLQESSQEESSCGDSAKLTNSAVTDCEFASPVSPSTQTCENSGLSMEQLTLSPHHPPANPSPLKENVWEVLIQETVSPPSCNKLEEVNPNSLSWKTCLDCYQLPLFPETNPEHIFGRCSGSFTAMGTMRNGLLYQQPSTELFGKEKGSCLLPRPGALSWSGNGRPPGTTKSEAKAKKLGILQKNEVFNPDWLELQFGLPRGWTSPQECRAATQLLALVEPPSEIASTPDSLPLPLEESCTCPSCGEALLNLADGCAFCGYLLGDSKKSPSKDIVQSSISPDNSSPSKSKEQLQISPGTKNPSKNRRRKGLGSGSIHWRTITKNGKDYPQAYYHWKENGQKKTKYIPKKLLGVIQEAEAAKRPVIEILELLGVGVNPSNSEVLRDIEISPSKEALEIDPSNKISPSKMRRHKGEGSGSIHWRTITKGGKDYPQAYYHYEFWNQGDRLIKSTKYIPKRLLTQVQQLELEKAPVREILAVLGVVELREPRFPTPYPLSLWGKTFVP